jgi:hypothetical protein
MLFFRIVLGIHKFSLEPCDLMSMEGSSVLHKLMIKFRISWFRDLAHRSEF